MKVTMNVLGAELSTEVHDLKMAFRFFAEMKEVFGHDTCGNCQSKSVSPRFRTATSRDGRACEYFSMICNDCRHEFSFGQKNTERGELFPKTRGQDGRDLPHGGWMPPWKPQEQQVQAYPTPGSPQPAEQTVPGMAEDDSIPF